MDLALLGSLGTVFTGLQGLIISEIGSQVKDFFVDKAKAALLNKKLEDSFCKCGDFASHFENNGSDEFGQTILTIFSKESLLDLYHQLKKESGYNYQSFIKKKLKDICDKYNVEAYVYIELFIGLFEDAVYQTDKELFQEIYLGDWRDEENQNFLQSHTNDDKIIQKLDEISSSVNDLVAGNNRAQKSSSNKESTDKNPENIDISKSFCCQKIKRVLYWDLKYPNHDIYWNSEKKRLSSLKKLTAQWKGEREAAPAWFIMPYTKRSLLRSYSRFEDLLYTCKNASAKERFDFAYELIWRYEHAYLSYSGRMVKSVRDIFDSYDIDDGEDSANHWFYLGLFLLREYREELDDNNWHTVYDQLKQKVTAISDGDARLKFEQIKHLFAQMRISDTCRLLAGFTCKKSSYEMRLQIIGIKVECGLLETSYEELTILEKELVEYNEDPVRRGSLLGLLYCMQSFIYQAINPLERGPALQNIWNQEKLYAPFFDFSTEQLYFERELNRSRKKDFKTEPFDITREDRTIILGSNPHHENYDFYRLLDTSCLPLHVNNVRLLDEDVSDFVTVLIRQFHYIGWQTLLRLASNKTAEKLLTRKELSGLLVAKNNTLSDAFDYIFNAVNEDISSVKALLESQRGNAYSHILNNGIFLLQRLLSVVDRSRQKKLIDLMCKLIDSDVIKESSVLNHWISDVMKATDEHVKADCLNKLLCCATRDQSHYHTENVLDPFDVFASFERVQHLYENAFIEPCTVDMLLEKAEKDEKNRRHIFSRLEQLYRVNRLDNNQKERFAKALWESAPEGSLPYGESYYPSFFLHCPEPNGVDVTSIIKTNLLDENPFKAVREKELSAFSFGGYTLWDKIISVNREDTNFWTVEEAETLFKEFVQYWDSLKSKYDKSEHKEFYEDEFSSRVRAFISVVTSFSRSQVQSLPKPLREQVLKVAAEIRDYGICALQISVLATEIDNLDSLEEPLIHGLRSSDKREANVAVGASGLLIMNCYGEKVTGKILHEILLICLYRKEPGLQYALNVLHNLFYGLGDIKLYDKDLKLMQGILISIASQTKYDSLLNSSEATFRDNILTRVSCASLAYQFYLYEESCGIDHSEATLEWRNICIGDKSALEFAEVRRRWLE